MKLSVLLLLALPALSSASSPLETMNNTERRNVSFMNSDPIGSPEITANRSMLTDLLHLTATKLRQKRQVQSASSVSVDGSNLEWVTWNNLLPNFAVSIYNKDFDRTDYVCKYKCEAGFYSPSQGPYCHYSTAIKVDPGSPFALLVNNNSFEILEWKEDSRGSVPKSSVKTCPGGDIYIGMNKYGLGKVATKDKVFYLPWKGKVFKYSEYQVLAINEDIISQEIYYVRYNTDESKVVPYPQEIIRKTSISNSECRSVVKKDTLSKTYELEQRWDHPISVKAGVKTIIKAGIPFIDEAGIEISAEVTYQHTWGNAVTEMITDTVSLEITAPPNHSCIVNMLRYKVKVDIPFTALLSRTYANGEIHTTSITGTYDSVQVAEVRAVVDRCDPLENSKPCP
ncbi:Natterin-4 [Dissostichus eleginoides]|nr:Natterin-4 [Dissostichus eleginoides]